MGTYGVKAENVTAPRLSEGLKYSSETARCHSMIGWGEKEKKFVERLHRLIDPRMGPRGPGSLVTIKHLIYGGPRLSLTLPPAL